LNEDKEADEFAEEKHEVAILKLKDEIAHHKQLIA
jgi:hypothetical protein